MSNQSNYFKKPMEKVSFNEEIAEKICAGIASGLYLYQILTEKGMPTRRSVTRWKSERPDFAEALKEAYEEQAERLEKESDAIVADESADTLPNGRGGFSGNCASVPRATLQLNRLKHRMEIRVPHIYKPETLDKKDATTSDDTTVEIANPNGVTIWPTFLAKDYKSRG